MRGKQAVKRKLRPDVKYGSTVVSKFINYLMKDGKRGIAQRIVYDCFAQIDEQIAKGKLNKDRFADGLAVFDTAIKNVTPQLEVRGRRIGGGNYQVPYPVRGERKYFLAMHWLITAADNKKGKPMATKLAQELMAAINEEGDAFKKKADVQRMAESNRAFAHFARY
jgi:small subunit ribosomal protein S7